MATTVGADPDSLDRAAADLDDFARQLRLIRHRLTGEVASRAWKGPRADRFRCDWESSYGPWLDHAAEYVESAVRRLHDNANQQRVASGGVAKPYGFSLVGAVGSTVSGAVTLEHRAGNWALRAASDLGRSVAHDVRTVEKATSEMVASKEFNSVLNGIDLVSSVAPLIAIIPLPGAQVVAVAVGVTAAALVFAGHAAQMANSGKWDAGKLEEDGFSTVMSVAGAGGATKAAKMVKGASEVNILSHLTRDYHLASPASNMLVLRSAQGAFEVGSHSVQVVKDVQAHDYNRAAHDGATLLSSAADTLGKGPAGVLHASIDSVLKGSSISTEGGSSE